MPLNTETGFWLNTEFWVGLLFVTFPLNYLVYGLNDYNDLFADKHNKRKGNFLFGAISTMEELKRLPMLIAMVVLPFILYFSLIRDYKMLLLLLFMILINILYNFKPFRIKERPPFEILIQVGYVFTALFSVKLNGLEMLPWQTLLYLCLFAFQAHIAGEIMDIEPDIVSGKKTTATLLGRKNTKIIMLLLLVTETFILSYWFQDYILAAFLGLFSIWLVLDTFFIYKNRPYTVFQMKLFGVLMNVSAVLSMIWILYSGKLLNPLF